MPTSPPVTPPHEVQKVSDLTVAAVTQKLAQTCLEAKQSHPVHAPLDASKLRLKYTKNPMKVPALDDPIRSTGSQCTDHMITCRWTTSMGWDAPELKPYGNIPLAPTASVLHYATECFEGMKMYRGHDGKMRLFRPEKNCRRMLMSAARISLPAFDHNELLKLVMALVSVDAEKWVPRRGTCLYLRPTMIGSAAGLGVNAPKEALLYIIAVFVSHPCTHGMTVSFFSQHG